MASAPKIGPRAWADTCERAAELGFDGLGAAHAEELGAARARLGGAHEGSSGLAEWLRAGHHGSMGWMAGRVAEREDPRAWFSGARTVLVGLVSHDASGEPGDPGTEGGPGPRGRIARYAWGRDYHLVVGRMLVELGRFLEREVPGVRWRRSVDTGPLMEKPLAVLAGLGWVGKHGNLLRTRGSSWTSIGVLVTDAEMSPSEPFATDHCGTCTACMDACPTGAIVRPSVVDSRRCISHATIELREAAPRELRGSQGSWVFGCDACQDVCPWNRHRSRSGDPRFTPGPLGRGPLLSELLQLDAARFRQATPKSALKRARREGLVRSAATAAGNSGDTDLVPLLGRLLDDPDESVRTHAAWALGRLGGRQARDLLDRVARDPAVGVRREAEVD